MIIILIKILRTNACEAFEYFFYARMYSGNSVRLNKTKIRWKGIFLEVCVVFNLSQISLLWCVVLDTLAMWQVYVM